jgi:hypothetical protein
MSRPRDTNLNDLRDALKTESVEDLAARLKVSPNTIRSRARREGISLPGKSGYTKVPDSAIWDAIHRSCWVWLQDDGFPYLPFEAVEEVTKNLSVWFAVTPKTITDRLKRLEAIGSVTLYGPHPLEGVAEERVIPEILAQLKSNAEFGIGWISPKDSKTVRFVKELMHGVCGRAFQGTSEFEKYLPDPVQFRLFKPLEKFVFLHHFYQLCISQEFAKLPEATLRKMRHGSIGGHLLRMHELAANEFALERDALEKSHREGQAAIDDALGKR